MPKPLNKYLPLFILPLFLWMMIPQNSLERKQIDISWEVTDGEIPPQEEEKGEDELFSVVISPVPASLTIIRPEGAKNIYFSNDAYRIIDSPPPEEMTQGLSLWDDLIDSSTILNLSQNYFAS